MKEVKIIGTGRYLPERVITNDDIAKFVDTDDQWISSRTGIKERRLSEGENTSDLAYKAALKAIEKANISSLDLDLIIVATATPDEFMPSTACIVQNKIGAVNAACFDISAACSGFIYGLNIATQFIKTGQSKNALIIGAEVLSKIVDWKDRNTCVLFGDGAGAAILSSSNEKGIISIHAGADGTKGEFLTCLAVPVNNIVTKVEESLSSTIDMNGKEIFKFAVKIIPEGVEAVLKNTGYCIEDIKYIVPHQANSRIIEAAAKKLKVNEEKFYMNLDKYGNTSAATIGIAIDEMVEKGLLLKGDKILLVGFGGGLTWGSALIKWI